MKKILTSIAMCIALIVAPVKAQTPTPTFFHERVADWDVVGYERTSIMNPGCTIEKRWEDGSRYKLIIDLDDGEVMMAMNFSKWKFKPNDKEIRSKIYIRKDKKRVTGGEVAFFIVNETTIMYRYIAGQLVFPALRQGDEMEMAIPEHLSKTGAIISIVNMDAAFLALAECMHKFDTLPGSKSKTDGPPPRRYDL